jgi:hypothetical protein
MAMVTMNTINVDDPATAALPLPGGGTVGTASAAEMARKLVAAGVPNASHEAGRQENAAAYSTFIAKGKSDAGDAWHKAWLAEHGSN